MKEKCFLLFLMLFIALNQLSAQTTDISSKQPESTSIEAKLLAGFWESADSLKYKIEFVDANIICFLNQPGAGQYTFIKDSLNMVSPHGFIAAWPPFDCKLKLISKDTLQATYLHLGNDEAVQYYVKVK